MRPRGDTAERVVKAFNRNPKATSTDLGEMLGLHPAYVRKTLTRRGLKLHGARKRRAA
jgi:hypothetical protein